jgi:hypothetical protein
MVQQRRSAKNVARSALRRAALLAFVSSRRPRAHWRRFKTDGVHAGPQVMQPKGRILARSCWWQKYFLEPKSMSHRDPHTMSDLLLLF